MKISKQEKTYYQKKFNDLKKDERFFEMKTIVHHRHSTTYNHVCKVGEQSLKWAYKLPFKFNMDDLILGSMLHDFYLYDHNIKHRYKHHWLRHPRISLKNAQTYFNINHRVAGIIVNHMWPLTFLHIPKSKEAWLVCLADKYIAIKECFRKKHKRKNIN